MITQLVQGNNDPPLHRLKINLSTFFSDGSPTLTINEASGVRLRIGYFHSVISFSRSGRVNNVVSDTPPPPDAAD